MALKMSRKTMLAIEAVLDIAYFGGGRPVQAREIAQRQGVSDRFLEPVMQSLVRAKLLNGQRGPRGGYTLAKDAGEITIGSIVRVVSDTAKEQAKELPSDASNLRRVVVAPFWSETLRRFHTQLDEISIADLRERARGSGVRPDGDGADAGREVRSGRRSAAE